METQGVLIDGMIVNEREKAVEIQQWHSSGSDPKTCSRFFWIPKSCIIERTREGILVKKWFVTQNNLWKYV